jgi:glycosyltransferase involved in cell wall biosynthesis
MRPVKDPLDIGIFFGRPERSEVLAERLRARGFHVVVYNNRGIPGRYLSVRYAFLPALFRLLSTHHRIYLTAVGFLPYFCLYLNRVLRGLPYIYNATGLKSATYRERSRRWPFPRLAERWLYPALMNRIVARATRIICNSRYLQSRLESQFPEYAHKIVTIYNGVELDVFASGRRISIDGIPSGATKLLAVMTWNYEGKARGATLIIDAMEYVLEKYPDAHLIIAAKTTHQRYAQEIEDFLATKRCRGSVKILYNQTNVPDLLRSCDLFVYAAPEDSNDSLPRTLIEAHAASLPIVTAATAGCPEIVLDSVTGFVVPYDAKALADRAIDLLGDPVKRQEMGMRGRDHVYKLFNWEMMANAYADLFRDAVSDQIHYREKRVRAG